jgi:glycopeptide antibiotics resistance protein
MTFNPRYFQRTLVLLFIEIWIAVSFDDRLIRPLVGDVLVVILIYCAIGTFWKIRKTVTIGSVFGFACIVEGLQYFQFVDRVGWRQYKLLAVIIGTTFDWKDIIAYALGAAIVLGWENKPRSSRKLKSAQPKS